MSSVHLKETMLILWELIEYLDLDPEVLKQVLATLRGKNPIYFTPLQIEITTYRES